MLVRMDVNNSIHVGPNVFGDIGLYYNGALIASNPYASEAPAGTSQRILV